MDAEFPARVGLFLLVEKFKFNFIRVNKRNGVKKKWLYLLLYSFITYFRTPIEPCVLDGTNSVTLLILC